MPLRHPIFALLTLLVLLAGCGGGGAALPETLEEPVVEALSMEALWSATAGGSNDCCTSKVAAFEDCSSISIGSMSGSATFGRDEEGETTLEATSESDGFIARYDPEGQLAWAKLVPGPSWTVIQDVETAKDGSFVLCGYLWGAATFDLGGGNQTELVPNGDEDGFLACYEGDGSLRWVHRLGSGDDVEALAVTTRPDGSIVVGGLFLGTLVLGQGEEEQTTLESAGYLDGFVACYGAQGDLLWAQQTAAAGSYDLGSVWALDCFQDGSVAVSGDYEGTLILGLGEAAETVLTSSAGGNDIYLARYDVDGLLIWAKSASGSGDGSVFDLAVTPDGDIRLVGSFTGEIEFRVGLRQLTLFSEGAGDGFVAAFQGDGQYEWAVRMGGEGSDALQGLSVLPDGRSVVGGYFQGTASVGADLEEQIVLESAGDGDLDGIFGAVSADGHFVCAARLGGTGDDFLLTVAATGPGSSLFGGSFVQTANISEPELSHCEMPGIAGATEMDGQGACDACLVHIKR